MSERYIQLNLRIMKVLGQPIFFHYLEVFFIERYKSTEEYANGTLEKFHYERFFTIGGVYYRMFHCSMYNAIYNGHGCNKSVSGFACKCNVG